MERLYPHARVFADRCLHYSCLLFLGQLLFNANNIAPWTSVGSRIALRRKYNLEVCILSANIEFTVDVKFQFHLEKRGCRCSMMFSVLLVIWILQITNQLSQTYRRSQNNVHSSGHNSWTNKKVFYLKS